MIGLLIGKIIRQSVLQKVIIKRVKTYKDLFRCYLTIFLFSYACFKIKVRIFKTVIYNLRKNTGHLFKKQLES